MSYQRGSNLRMNNAKYENHGNNNSDHHNSSPKQHRDKQIYIPVYSKDRSNPTPLNPDLKHSELSNHKSNNTSNRPSSSNSTSYDYNKSKNIDSISLKETQQSTKSTTSTNTNKSNNTIKLFSISVEQTINEYDIIAQIGEGTFGKVFKAVYKPDGSLVALKRIKIESDKDGFPVTAAREIKLLTQINHKNVVKLKQLLSSIYEEEKGVFMYMVFEYLQHDLTGILSRITFQPEQIKCLVRQLFEGLEYIHDVGILHRDLKGSNILLSSNGELKIADFGLARNVFSTFRPKQSDYTNRVVTLWYRSPELLLGATQYDYSIDIWSAGCIFLEVLDGKATFTGKDEVTQLDKIWRICGTPNIEEYPGVLNLPWWEFMQPANSLPSKLFDQFSSKLSKEGMKLIENLLSIDPTKRMTATQVLKSEYFQELPLSCELQDLPSIEGDWHEYESKLNKKKGDVPETNTNAQQTAPNTLPPPKPDSPPLQSTIHHEKYKLDSSTPNPVLSSSKDQTRKSPYQSKDSSPRPSRPSTPEHSNESNKKRTYSDRELPNSRSSTKEIEPRNHNSPSPKRKKSNSRHQSSQNRSRTPVRIDSSHRSRDGTSSPRGGTGDSSRLSREEKVHPSPRRKEENPRSRDETHYRSSKRREHSPRHRSRSPNRSESRRRSPDGRSSHVSRGEPRRRSKERNYSRNYRDRSRSPDPERNYSANSHQSDKKFHHESKYRADEYQSIPTGHLKESDSRDSSHSTPQFKKSRQLTPEPVKQQPIADYEWDMSKVNLEPCNKNTPNLPKSPEKRNNISNNIDVNSKNDGYGTSRPYVPGFNHTVSISQSSSPFKKTKKSTSPIKREIQFVSIIPPEPEPIKRYPNTEPLYTRRDHDDYTKNNENEDSKKYNKKNELYSKDHSQYTKNNTRDPLNHTKDVKRERFSSK